MAITAAIALSDSTISMAQTIAATCTITAGVGDGPVLVTGFVPTCAPTGVLEQSVAVALGAPPTGPGMDVTVPDNDTLDVTFSVTPNAPSSGEGLAMPASQVLDVGATIYLSDGSVITATPAALTVASPDFIT